MERLDFSITLTIRAPFLFPGIQPGRFGLDRCQLTDVHGRPVMPRDQVKGLVRHGLEALGRTDLISQCFGAASGDVAPNRLSNEKPERSAEALAPDHGRIFFTDLVADKVADRGLLPMPRVEIEPNSGAAKTGHLALIEQVVRPAKPTTFSGSVIIFTDEDEGSVQGWLRAALDAHLSVGAMKSVGFGEVIRVDVKERPVAKPCTPTGRGSVALWEFELDRPYLVDAERIAENCYRGRREVSGAALKGLLAEALKRRGISVDGLEQALSDLKVGFAAPAGSGPAMPASIIWHIDREGFFDLAGSEQCRGRIDWQADWKGDIWDKARSVWKGGAPVCYEERVHTAIDVGTGAANDAMLFSTLACKPAGCFRAELSFTGAAERHQSLLIEALCGELPGLGRTDAVLRTTSLTLSAPTSPQQPEGLVHLKLETPGLLANFTDAGEGGDATEAYRQFWSTVLPRSPLRQQFSRQRLIGGYQALRFRSESVYRPFLLTEPGAIFEFDLNAGETGILCDIIRNGLCRKEVEGVKLDWRNCPFVSENGYGSFSLYRPGVE
ncbi:RAMP superfamily CRISPR-associated protein [Salipiger abyssi]|uniref:RAMP superfamily CRISPR-associated protein n=1 Tax=Salipiger abyssi TaxID=1250539 RepID=UPI001A8E8480|nr:RAMP superfamily CRISPR-associated protein [Salipiger abyssi]MBN9890539.1 hypothetical protein [Salipiger abyssi]